MKGNTIHLKTAIMIINGIEELMHQEKNYTEKLKLANSCNQRATTQRNSGQGCLQSTHAGLSEQLFG